MQRDNDWLIVVLILAALWYFTSGKGIPSAIAPAKATAAVYVHEKDDGPVPSPVLAALSKLNLRGIVATTFDDDVTDGSGETPEQYKVPLAAAKEAGMPALVVTNGPAVIRVVKSPTTEASVLEAVP